jgi:glucose-1-phosphate adenylyltransferase
LPRFNFFDMSAPIFSRPRFLPASKINGAEISHAVISDGCIINRCRHHPQHRRHAQSWAGNGANRRTILLGSDYYESNFNPSNSMRRAACRGSAWAGRQHLHRERHRG